jgi:hypothetical protein
MLGNKHTDVWLTEWTHESPAGLLEAKGGTRTPPAPPSTEELPEERVIGLSATWDGTSRRRCAPQQKGQLRVRFIPGRIQNVLPRFSYQSFSSEIPIVIKGGMPRAF